MDGVAFMEKYSPVCDIKCTCLRGRTGTRKLLSFGHTGAVDTWPKFNRSAKKFVDKAKPDEKSKKSRHDWTFDLVVVTRVPANVEQNHATRTNEVDPFSKGSRACVQCG